MLVEGLKQEIDEIKNLPAKQGKQIDEKGGRSSGLSSQTSQMSDHGPPIMNEEGVVSYLAQRKFYEKILGN